jgi:hypothetical protein
MRRNMRAKHAISDFVAYIMSIFIIAALFTTRASFKLHYNDFADTLISDIDAHSLKIYEKKAFTAFVFVWLCFCSFRGRKILPQIHLFYTFAIVNSFISLL